MSGTASSSPATAPSPRLMAGAFAALRIFTGLVWLSNALAKVWDTKDYDLGVFSFNLIARGTAKSILADASDKTGIAPLGNLYQDLVLANWGFFAVFLTVTELAIGLGLVLGVASRLAPIGGLALLTPIWVMLWDRGQYLWTYPAEDLFPLLLLAIVPSGRVLGVDRALVRRFGARWPF